MFGNTILFKIGVNTASQNAEKFEVFTGAELNPA